MPRTVITPSSSFAANTYTGNGVDGRFIDVGFTPDLVIVKAETTEYAIFRTSSMVGDETAYFANAAANAADLMQSFAQDGFTIGTGANTAGTRYHYLAFAKGGVANIAVGSFVGTGVDDLAITGLGFQPMLVVVKRNGAQLATFKDSLDTTQGHVFANSADANDRIKTLTSDGFTLGTSALVNASPDTFHYFAIGASANLFVGTYTGDGVDNKNITGVGFRPGWVLVKTNAGGSSAIQRPSLANGDSASTFANAAFTANLIQSLSTDGFQVGANSAVNTNLAVYHYLCFKEARGRKRVL